MAQEKARRPFQPGLGVRRQGLRASLPIDPLLPELVRAIASAPALVLEAPPGAGKTTRVPPALLGALAPGKEIVVLQPRRLATRLAAERVASELGEPLRKTCGYQVRFEDFTGPGTRLKFVTEGVLGRRLVENPTLDPVGVVVLDEFHERHLAADISLALLRRIQQGPRPDLRIVVMSATLDAAPVARFLGNCPALRSEGRPFPVEVRHLPAADERPLEERVLAAMKQVVRENLPGDVLVFLPGAGEIRRCKEKLGELSERHGFRVLPLHGEMPAREQDLAVKPGQGRKVILSTNVAETSVTIEGVGIVIDSGLARVASHSPWSGLPILKVQKVSKASAVQRMGRAGRTREGVCLRLYTQADFDLRPDHDSPEVHRSDMAETVLQLRSLGVKDLAGFPFFEAPPPAALTAADQLLARLGAVDRAGTITTLGRRLLAFPLHPRQSRVLAEAEARGIGGLGALLVALLSERDIRLETRTRFGNERRSRPGEASGASDLLDMAERFREAQKGAFSASRLRALELEPIATRAVERVQRRLARQLRAGQGPRESDEESAQLRCLLAGYPDRVAKRRAKHSPELLLCEGGAATLSEASVVREPELLVALDAEERPGTNRGARTVVRLASEIQPEWLLELFPEGITEVDQLEWNASSGRVERTSRLAYGEISLTETRGPAEPSPEASQILCEAVRKKGPKNLLDRAAIEQWAARLEVIASLSSGSLSGQSAEFLEEACLLAACEGRLSLAEVEQVDVAACLRARMDPSALRLLATETPERVKLPGGREVRVHYEAGKPPWVESRLQDFFGLGQGPKICSGKVPLVLHLLAPNQRAVQVTTDLAGFWERHYPALRRELSRKYPRHAWPEDPIHASPPAMKPRRSH